MSERNVRPGSWNCDWALDHAHSTVRYRTDSASWFAKLSSTAQRAAVQCALKVVVTRGESWEAMAEWVMFDAAFSDISDLPSVIFFGFSTWCKSLARDWSLQSWLDLERPFLGVHRKMKKVFPLHYWRGSISTGQISSRHRLAQPRNKSKSFRKKSDHQSALRTTWQTYRQKDYKKRAQRWDRHDWSTGNWYMYFL